MQKGNGTVTLWKRYGRHGSLSCSDRYKMARNNYVRAKREEQVRCERKLKSTLN